MSISITGYSVASFAKQLIEPPRFYMKRGNATEEERLVAFVRVRRAVISFDWWESYRITVAKIYDTEYAHACERIRWIICCRAPQFVLTFV